MALIPSPEGGTLTKLTDFGTKFEAILVQTDEGREEEYRGHNRHRAKTAIIGRAWDVFLPDGTFVGVLTYDMVTHERHSGRNTYVDARWRTPGWCYRHAAADGTRGTGHRYNTTGKGAAVRRLIENRKGFTL